MCGRLSCAPYRGPGPQPRHVPWLGIEPATLRFTGWHSIHWDTPARAVIWLFDNSYPRSVKWYLIVVLIWISLMTMTNYVEHLFMCLLAFYISFLESCLFSFLAYFLAGLFFLLLGCESFWHVLDTSSLIRWCTNILSHSVGCLFAFLMVSFETEKFKILMKSSLFIVFFGCLYYWWHGFAKPKVTKDLPPHCKSHYSFNFYM